MRIVVVMMLLLGAWRCAVPGSLTQGEVVSERWMLAAVRYNGATKVSLEEYESPLGSRLYVLRKEGVYASSLLVEVDGYAEVKPLGVRGRRVRPEQVRTWLEEARRKVGGALSLPLSID